PKHRPEHDAHDGHRSPQDVREAPHRARRHTPPSTPPPDRIRYRPPAKSHPRPHDRHPADRGRAHAPTPTPNTTPWPHTGAHPTPAPGPHARVRPRHPTPRPVRGRPHHGAQTTGKQGEAHHREGGPRPTGRPRTCRRTDRFPTGPFLPTASPATLPTHDAQPL